MHLGPSTQWGPPRSHSPEPASNKKPDCMNGLVHSPSNSPATPGTSHHQPPKPVGCQIQLLQGVRRPFPATPGKQGACARHASAMPPEPGAGQRDPTTDWMWIPPCDHDSNRGRGERGALQGACASSPPAPRRETRAADPTPGSGSG